MRKRAIFFNIKKAYDKFNREKTLEQLEKMDFGIPQGGGAQYNPLPIGNQ